MTSNRPPLLRYLGALGECLLVVWPGLGTLLLCAGAGAAGAAAMWITLSTWK
jgi:hypothetical protein